MIPAGIARQQVETIPRRACLAYLASTAGRERTVVLSVRQENTVYKIQRLVLTPSAQKDVIRSHWVHEGIYVPPVRQANQVYLGKHSARTAAQAPTPARRARLHASSARSDAFRLIVAPANARSVMLERL